MFRLVVVVFGEKIWEEIRPNVPGTILDATCRTRSDPNVLGGNLMGTGGLGKVKAFGIVGNFCRGCLDFCVGVRFRVWLPLLVLLRLRLKQ